MATVDLGSVEVLDPTEEKDAPRARPSLLRGTFALSQTVWNVPDRNVADPKAHCPWNPDPTAPAGTPQATFIVEPRSILHCLRFDGAGRISGRVRINTRNGTRDAELTGTYFARKNMALNATDGFMTVTIASFGVVNELYFVRRTPDEIDLLMIRSRTTEGDTQPAVLGGTLKRIARGPFDWIDWWPF